MLIGVCLPHNYHLRIMAKEALFHNKALAWLIRKLGAFPVTRGTADIQSVKTAMQVIKDGQNLLIFPEGPPSAMASAMWTACPPTPTPASPSSASAAVRPWSPSLQTALKALP